MFVFHFNKKTFHCCLVFGNRFLYKQFGVKPQAHKNDIGLLERMQEQSLAFGVPINEEEQPLGNYIDENDTLILGESPIQFIHVPGHSQGSLCVYFKKENWLFSGDVLFLRCIGRTDLPGGNFSQLTKGYVKNYLFFPKKQKFLQVMDLIHLLVTKK